MTSEADSVPAPPPAAERVFGARLDYAVRFARLLATDGLRRGLLGPRELPRIWERHLLNCAALADLIPYGVRVVDVGSGAGLPGLALACRRADLRVDLVESLRRRVDFLTEAVDTLGLHAAAHVVPGRAEDAAVVRQVGGAGWVTARAVAPLDRLARWCLPLLAPGGSLLAMKGARAEAELAASRQALRRAGAESADIHRCGVGVLDDVVTVVVIRRRTNRPSGRKGVP